MIYSFDVFDTVLMRMVLVPKDVFRFMEAGISDDSWLLPKVLKANFAHARVLAEFTANRRSDKEEVGLLDIYDNLGQRFKLDKDQILGLANYEMEVESELLVAVPGVSEILSEARKEAGFIVFVSDMYLPSAFVRDLLKREGLLGSGDYVYLSNENGCSKRSGRLFLKVLEDHGLAASELSHCGDSSHSDCLVPHRLGIRVHRRISSEIALKELFAAYKNKALYACDLFRAWWAVGRVSV